MGSEGSTGARALSRDDGSEAWTGSQHRIGKSSARPILTSQSANDICTLPTLPDISPRSSASSLCSCDQRHDSSGLGRSAPCSTSSKTSQSAESLQLLSDAGSTSHESTTRNRSDSRAGSPTSMINNYESPFASVEALPRPSTSTDKASSVKSHCPQGTFASFSDNVQQLILEADEAFKAVGSALNDIKLRKDSFSESFTMQSFQEEPRPESSNEIQHPSTPEPVSEPIPEPSPIMEPQAIEPRVLEPRVPQDEHRLQSRLSTSTTSSSCASTTGPKTKQKMSKKVKVKPSIHMKPNRKASATKRGSKIGPRWTLTENVSELFSGKLFHKIEVNEMLTPGQIEAYKLRRMSKLQSLQLQTQKSNEEKWESQSSIAQSFNDEKPGSRSSTDEGFESRNSSEDRLESQRSLESIKTDADSIDTATEPSHLDDLASRTRSVSIDSDARSDDSQLATFFDDADDTESHGNEVEDQTPSTPPSKSKSTFQSPTAKVKNCSNSLSPSKTTGRLAGCRKPIAVLSTISEVSAVSSPISPQEEVIFNTKIFGSQETVVADSDHVFLQSSPQTLTVPSFRHGPIRFDKSDLMPEPDPKLGADDGLDWTAFQMAILGGAGDWNSDSDDTIRRREAEEVSDLVDWWNTWSFGGSGLLVTEEIEATSPTSTVSGGEFSDVSSYNDIAQDHPYSAHHKWQEMRRQAASKGRKLDLNLNRGSVNGSIFELDSSEFDGDKIYIDEDDENWDSQPRKFSDRTSLASLPQSPMLDLRVIRNSTGDNFDVVPMGYNLGHDLGDFLKWESENVYAGAFYAPAVI
jgi:hypothetical protein